MSQFPGADLGRTLTTRGAIQDPAWHRAVLAVPREAFIPETLWIWSSDDPGTFRPYPRTDPDVQRWIHDDYVLMTQVDDGEPAGPDGTGIVPTSSISQPSLVVTMLEALDTDGSHRVLEIGTGTGYNTALLCERLGDERMTSVEVDEGVAEQAARVLGDLGYAPDLRVGDGAVPLDARPYDRVLSTVAAREIPRAWIDQTCSGGVIVTPWGPGFTSSALLRLEVSDGGTARGRFVGDAAFMWLRDQRRPVGTWRDFVDEEASGAVDAVTMVNPRCVTDRNAGWGVVLGHLVPDLAYASFEAADGSGEATVYVFDRADSWALGEYAPEGAPYEQRRAGPRDLWAEIGAARYAWEQSGRPGRDRLGLTVTAGGQHLLWVDDPARPLGK